MSIILGIKGIITKKLANTKIKRYYIHGLRGIANRNKDEDMTIRENKILMWPVGYSRCVNTNKNIRFYDFLGYLS